MKFDLVTLATLSGLIAALNAVFFMCIWRLNKEYAGLQEWMAASLCFPIGCYLIYFSDSSQVIYAHFSANIIAICATVLLVVGCRKFFQFNKNNNLIALLLFVPFSLFVGYFTFTKPNIELRSLIMATVAITACFIILIVSISPRLPNHNKGRTLMGSLCIFLIGVFSLQIHSLVSPQNSMLSNSDYTISLVIISTLFIAHYCFTLCCIILCNEKSQFLLAESKLEMAFDNSTTDDKPAAEFELSEPALHIEELAQPATHAANESDDAVRIEPTINQDPLEPTVAEQQEPTLAPCAEATSDTTNNEPALQIEPELPKSQPFQAQLINLKLLQRHQKKSPAAEFNQQIEQLPQQFSNLILDAKKSHVANQSVQAKSQLHQLATLADTIGLEQLADMALQLELSTLDHASFEQLSQLSISSIEQLQQVFLDDNSPQIDHRSA
ncbi:MAG: hypothetical protein HRU23_01065 [Gammaproteobacteria bacterium]|nr:hypothetical protein [Gammaproteobacteria bacterium]